jgi:signal transduction histidine kinase
MKAQPSLLRGLAADLLVAQAVGLLCVIVLVITRLHATVDELETRDMLEVASDIAAHLHFGERPTLDLPPSASARFSPFYGRYSYAVLDGDGRPLLASDPVVAPLAPIDDGSGHFETPHGAALLWGVTRRFVVEGRSVWVQVAEDMNHQDVLMDEMVEGFLAHAAWLLVPLFAVLAALTIGRMRRRLQPVLHASAQAAGIGPAASHVRLPTAAVPAEILPLVEAVNRGLARLDTALKTQTEFIEHAAHELRTPLTVLRTRLASLEEGELRTKLDEDAAILSRLITQLLRATELDGMEIETAGAVDLPQLCRAIVAYLRPAAEAQGKRLVVSAEGGTIRGNVEVLGHAATNLIENALAHTPDGGAVEIRCGALPVPFISVRDHGPGVPPEERDKVFQRFWRRDRGRGGGAGLGLSIVARAVEAHQGRIAIDDAPGGGARFTITFPSESLP